MGISTFFYLTKININCFNLRAELTIVDIHHFQFFSAMKEVQKINNLVFLQSFLVYKPKDLALNQKNFRKVKKAIIL